MQADGVRVTWLGHSTVELELDGVRLLTDPVLRRRVAHLRRVAMAPRELATPDAVLVSHTHYDHLDLPTLRRLLDVPRVIVPRGAGTLLRRRGFRGVVELAPGDELEVGPVAVRATEAVHGGWRPGVARDTPPLGFVVAGSATVYFAGDTGLFPGMSSLVPALDVALLPIGGWGPRLPEDHLDPERAAEALALLEPRLAIPVHWGTYRRLGLRPEPAASETPPERFRRLAAELAPEVEVVVLEPGQSVQVAQALRA